MKTFWKKYTIGNNNKKKAKFGTLKRLEVACSITKRMKFICEKSIHSFFASTPAMGFVDWEEFYFWKLFAFRLSKLFHSYFHRWSLTLQVSLLFTPSQFLCCTLVCLSIFSLSLPLSLFLFWIVSLFKTKRRYKWVIRIFLIVVQKF